MKKNVHEKSREKKLACLNEWMNEWMNLMNHLKSLFRMNQ